MSTAVFGAPAPLDLTKVTREQWLAARKLGGSDSPAICSLSEYRTRFDVWAEKVGLKVPFAGNEYTNFGLKLEPVIAAEFSERTAFSVSKCTEMYSHSEHDFITCSPDYFAFRGPVLGKDNGLAQIKNTSVYFAKQWDEQLPDAVHIQCQHELLVTGLPFCYAVALIGGNKLVWHEILPDLKIQERLIQILCEFWELVLTKTPPPMVAEDNDTIKRIFPESQDGLEVALPSEAEEWLELRAKAQEALKAATDQKDLAEANIKRLLGNAERGRIGKQIVTWKTSERKGYVVEPSTVRTLRISKEK